MSWQNSNYGLLYHLAGSKHTPEEAYRALSENLSSRQMATHEYNHAKKERALKKAKLQRKIDNTLDDIDKQLLILKMEKIGIHQDIEEKDYNYALGEIDFITKLMNILEPNCNWADGSISMEQGFQLAQQEERKQILLERAQLSLLSVGNIDQETLREVKSHPEGQALQNAFVQMVLDAKNGKLPLTFENKNILLLKQ
jgi:hypothetical protein